MGYNYIRLGVMAVGKKYNVYITSENMPYWESLDSRSGWVNDQLKKVQADLPEPEPKTDWQPPSSVTF
jgi:subtilase family serine protease